MDVIKQTKYIELYNALENSERIIIDVRTKVEYEELHIKDSINIPYEELQSISLDKNKTIFVYFQSGRRSNLAYKILLKLGYNVYDLGAINDINLPTIK